MAYICAAVCRVHASLNSMEIASLSAVADVTASMCGILKWRQLASNTRAASVTVAGDGSKIASWTGEQ